MTAKRFVEVVSPVRPDTTAGRYLARRGSDSGYMAIFQMPSLEEARRRVTDLGVRVVWKIDLDDIAGTHLHPKDIPGRSCPSTGRRRRVRGVGRVRHGPQRHPITRRAASSA